MYPEKTRAAGWRRGSERRISGLTLAGLEWFATSPAAQRRALSKPALETRNGTMKFSAQRTQVAAVAWPAAITEPWLIRVRMIPTTIAMEIVRRRLRRSRQNAQASRAARPRPRGAGWLGEVALVSGCRVGDVAGTAIA